MMRVSKLGQGKGVSAEETSAPPEILTLTEVVSKSSFITSMHISVTPAPAPFSGPCHFPPQSPQISIIMETKIHGELTGIHWCLTNAAAWLHPRDECVRN